MFDQVITLILGRRPQSSEATLINWERKAIIGETYPGALPQKGGLIRGILWHELAEKEVLLLDAFEGDGYQRQTVIVDLACGSSLPAIVYRWLTPDRMAKEQWSVDLFRARHLQDFYRTHAPPSDGL